MKLVKVIIVSMLALLIGCTTSITPDVKVTSWTGGMEVVDDQYRSAGSSSVVLGAYGRILREGTNRYQMDGFFIKEFRTAKPRIVELSFDNVQKIEKLGFELAQEAKANLGFNRTNKGNYKLIVVRPYDPSVFEKTLIKKLRSDSFLQNKVKNPDFRYIDSVVFIVNYDATKKIEGSITGSANIDRIAEGFTLEVNMGQNKKTDIKLPDNQIIAYQYRRLCWKNGEVVDTVKDLIGADAQACGQGYHKYPGPKK
jgi:hypothetical protein